MSSVMEKRPQSSSLPGRRRWIVVGALVAVTVVTLAILLLSRDPGRNDDRSDFLDLAGLAAQTFDDTAIQHSGDAREVTVRVTQPTSDDYRSLLWFLNELGLQDAVGSRMSTAEFLESPRAAETDVVAARWSVGASGDLEFVFTLKT